MFESRSGILWIGGLGFFAFAFLSNAVVPMLMYRDLPTESIEESVNANVMFELEDLAKRYPESFEKHYGKLPPPDQEAERRKVAAQLLANGRHWYVGEGCWHCHSQFVRPVSNESQRWGPVAKTEEFQNKLQQPVLFGTRRVGPDLSREGGRRSNDWHAVHFFQPQMVSTDSPMPNYPWFFDGAPDKPNDRGLAVILYVQWLGSWLESYPYYEEYIPVDEMEGLP